MIIFHIRMTTSRSKILVITLFFSMHRLAALGLCSISLLHGESQVISNMCNIKDIQTGYIALKNKTWHAINE